MSARRLIVGGCCSLASSAVRDQHVGSLVAGVDRQCLRLSLGRSYIHLPFEECLCFGACSCLRSASGVSCMRGRCSFCSGGGLTFPCTKSLSSPFSVAAEVISARWPAVICRAFLRQCCACLLSVSDSVAAVLSGPSFDLPVLREAPRLRGQMLADGHCLRACPGAACAAAQVRSRR